MCTMIIANNPCKWKPILKIFEFFFKEIYTNAPKTGRFAEPWHAKTPLPNREGRN